VNLGLIRSELQERARNMRIVDDARSLVTAVRLSEEEFQEWGASVSLEGFHTDFSSHGPSDSAHDELMSGPEDGEIVDQSDGEVEELGEVVSGTVDASSRVTVCKRKDPGDHVRRAELLRRFAPLIAKSAAQLRTLHRCAADGGPARKKARVAPHDVSAQMEVHVEVIAVRSARSLQRERDEFRRAIAAMEKTVEISDGGADFFRAVDGSADFFPLLVAALGGAQSCAFSRWRFEAATGLTLIPDGDEDDSCGLQGSWSSPESAIAHEDAGRNDLGGWLSP
jgi:hypothetical protein